MPSLPHFLPRGGAVTVGAATKTVHLAANAWTEIEPPTAIADTQRDYVILSDQDGTGTIWLACGDAPPSAAPATPAAGAETEQAAEPLARVMRVPGGGSIYLHSSAAVIVRLSYNYGG